MALTQFSGSLTWLQLCGLAAALCEGILSSGDRRTFRADLIYQPSHMAERWMAGAEAVAHVIPRQDDSSIRSIRGYAEGPSIFFRWAMTPGGMDAIRAKKMVGGLWVVEYQGEADTAWHRLVRDAYSEPCEPAATAAVRSAGNEP